MQKPVKIMVRAPSSIANLGCLFDVGAVAVDAFWDDVEIGVREGKGEIRLHVISKNNIVEFQLEKLSSNNIVVKTLKTYFNECLEKENSWDIDIALYKGVPVGKGLGSSAASISATLLSLWKIFPGKCGINEVFYLGGIMEGSISGEPHYDNVSASMFGGIVLLGDLTRKPPEILRLDWPNELVFVIGIPHDDLSVSEKTKYMRSILPEKIVFREGVKYYSFIPLLVKGIIEKNYSLIGKAVNYGGIVEEARAKLLKGYWETKETLLNHGALAVNISGAGPSIFALVPDEKSYFIEDVMEKKLSQHYSNYTVKVAPVAPHGAL